MTTGDRPVECDRLAETLRGLRTRTGLSLAALSSKTPYSKSSWERYLNGKTVPPRQAVVELCELAGERSGRPLALWELAEAAWSGRAASGRPAGTATAPVRTSPPDEAGGEAARRLRPGTLAAVLSAVVVVAVGVSLAAVGVFGTDGDAHAGNAPSTPAAAAKGCHGSGCTGKDPEAYGCGVAPPPQTLRQERFPGGTVIKIRRGAVCGAVWARIDLGKVGDRVEIVVPRRAPLRTVVKDKYDAQGAISTPMAAATRDDLTQVRACLVRQGERHCFGTGAAR
ncbi:helix-turn-helix domain-containing protein [Streptomyces sp. NPDC007264]|uniref:helix-turn-helix domain-containing protein n=1 Tax=Streptomyces sp. NPDC007264 TaxID=3364777 RepID=UPI0036DC4AC5